MVWNECISRSGLLDTEKEEENVCTKYRGSPNAIGRRPPLVHRMNPTVIGPARAIVLTEIYRAGLIRDRREIDEIRARW